MMASRYKVMIEKASLNLTEYVSTLRLLWKLLELSDQVKLQVASLKMEDDDGVVPELV